MGGIVGIVAFSIRNWRMTMGIMLFAVIGGLLAIDRLPLDAEPDVPIPFVNIQVTLPGISPEDAERLLIRPMETELKSVDGIIQMDGVALTNAAILTIEFEASHDLDKALADVLEKVDRARAEFPEEAQEPIVDEISNSSVPILTVNLWGDAPERALQRQAKDLQRRLESRGEILEVNITGERIDVLEAILDPSKIDSLGISFDEIAAAIALNNSLIPAGELKTDNGKFNIKLQGLISSPEDMNNLVVRRGANGNIVRMSDIAIVRSGYKDSTTIARFNGRKSVSLEVKKRLNENILETVQLIEELVNEQTASPEWPKGINASFSQSRAIFITDMRRELSSSIINAVILVFIVCIAALGWRSALFVGWAIPSSFLIAFFLFLVQGETINMMILFGLILSVGVLVDSAIVIIEYADRKMDEGLGRREAFQMAGERMFWPILSSTATTLAAFIPLLFWDTIPGKFMAYFPRTMIYVLTASMLMALIFLPTMGSIIGFKPKKKNNSNAALLAGADGDPSQLRGFTGVYVKFIRKLIQFPLLVILGLALLTFGIIGTFQASMEGPPPKPVAFFTQSPGDQIFVFARTRGNSTPEQSLGIAEELERRFAQIDGIESMYTVAGNASSNGFSFDGPGSVPADTTVKIYLELYPFAERRNLTDIIADIEQASQGINGVITEVKSVEFGPPIDKDIGIQISSEDRDKLREVTQKIRTKLETIEGLDSFDDNLPLPGIDWELVIDRAEAGRLGLDVGRIGSAIQFLTEGALVGKYRPLDVEEEVDIRIRYPKSARDLSQLDNLRIQTPSGAVPLSSVVKRVAKPRQDKIERRDLLPFYSVKANTQKGYATNKQVEILKDWISKEAGFPSDVNIKFLGQDEENAATAEFGKSAALAIIFMMGVILLLQFNSFYHVFLTLSAVILSLLGVLFGLSFYPYISSILVLTGTIALAGIVVNNNIVLIDTYQRLKAHGFSSEDAALRTAAQRLRPVTLTTLTTVIGLMPLVLAWQANIFTGKFSVDGSATSDIWAPISYVISCGLGFATILTLIITPVLLTMPTVVGRRLSRLRNKFKSSSSDGDNLVADEVMGTEGEILTNPAE